MKQRVSKVLAVMMVAVLMITGKADAATIAQGQHTIEHLVILRRLLMMQG